jgi:hypothetical protein
LREFKNHQKTIPETINRYIIQALGLKKSELAQILNTTKPTFTIPLLIGNGKWV